MKLEQVFQEWGNWNPGKPKVLEKLGGLSNQSYLVESVVESRAESPTESEMFVVRLNRESENLGVSRHREKEVLIAIKDLHFAPDISFFGSDYLVTNFVASNTKNSPNLEMIADLFLQIHRVDYSNQIVMNPLEQLSLYYHQIDSPDQKLKTCYEALANQDIASDPNNFCLCHHDLLPENIIQSNERVIVIDWEYAQYGDPLFDLAIYAESMNLDKSQTDSFISAYNDGNEKNLNITSLRKFRLIFALISLLWWKIKNPEKDISPGLLSLENRIFLTEPI